MSAPLPPRDQPPPPGPVTASHMPRPRRRTLGNGMRLLALPRPGLPLVTLQASIAVGDRDDPAGREGLATLAARMFKAGTVHRRSKEIDDAIEASGGSLECACDMDRTEIEVDVLSTHVPLALDLLADLLRYPVFPPEELSLEKGRMEEETRAMLADPDFVARDRAAAVLYGDHPYGRPAAAPPETLARLSRRDVVAFHLRHVVPSAVTLLAVGDVDGDGVLEQMSARFDPWEAATPPPAPPPARRPGASAALHLQHRPGSVQAVLRVVARCVNRSSPDFITLEVLNNVLGGSTTSRLFMNLRQGHGYTYGARSMLLQRPLGSDLAATCAVRNDVAVDALGEMYAEMDRLTRERVPGDEMATFQEEMVGHFPLSLESPHALAARVMSQQVFGLPVDYWDRYRKRIMAVRPADLQRVARRYLKRDALRTVVVGDAGALLPRLRKLGAVKRYAAVRRPATAAAAVA